MSNFITISRILFTILHGIVSTNGLLNLEEFEVNVNENVQNIDPKYLAVVIINRGDKKMTPEAKDSDSDSSSDSNDDEVNNNLFNTKKDYSFPISLENNELENNYIFDKMNNRHDQDDTSHLSHSLRNNWKTCNKKAAKVCIKSCKKTAKSVCSEYDCSRKTKKSLKKECKRNCKSQFAY